MKKTIALALVLALVLAFAAPAFAEGEKLTAEVVNNYEKNQVTLNVNMAADSKGCSGIIEVTYPKEALTFNSEVKGTLLANALIQTKSAEAGYIKSAFAGTDVITNAGTLNSYVFDINAGYTGKDLKIEVKLPEYLDGDAKSVEGIEGSVVVLDDEIPAWEPVVPTTAPVATEAPATEAPETTETPAPKPGPGGAMTLVSVAIISAVAGFGALSLRKKED